MGADAPRRRLGARRLRHMAERVTLIDHRQIGAPDDDARHIGHHLGLDIAKGIGHRAQHRARLHRRTNRQIAPK